MMQQLDHWLRLYCGRSFAALSVIALVMLVSCQPNTLTPHQVAILTLAQACEAYAGALRVLAPRRAAGLLSADDIANVEFTNQFTDRICVGPPPTDPSAAITRVNEAVSSVMLIVARSEGATQ